MTSWRRALLLGIVAWLVPFVVAVVIFPIHDSARPLFESIMAVAVVSTAVFFGLLYLRSHRQVMPREGFLLGVIWVAICVAIDAAFIVPGTVMKMTLAEYVADIGLTYLCFPVVTFGMAVARRQCQAQWP